MAYNPERKSHEAPATTNVKRLQGFLGMLNCYVCYLPNLSTVLAPLHELLAKDSKWTWGKRQEAAFNQAKGMLNSSDLLVHYDPHMELVLSCDASPYGLGRSSHTSSVGKKGLHRTNQGPCHLQSETMPS